MCDVDQELTGVQTGRYDEHCVHADVVRTERREREEQATASAEHTRPPFLAARGSWAPDAHLGADEKRTRARFGGIVDLDDVVETVGRCARRRHRRLGRLVCRVLARGDACETSQCAGGLVAGAVGEAPQSPREHLVTEDRHGRAKAALNELGDRLSAGKKVAPTRPHPRSPDTPPGNLLAGAAAGVLDKARDVGRQTVERVRAGA